MEGWREADNSSKMERARLLPGDTDFSMATDDSRKFLSRFKGGISTNNPN
jgi:hypothetical protein